MKNLTREQRKARRDHYLAWTLIVSMILFVGICMGCVVTAVWYVPEPEVVTEYIYVMSVPQEEPETASEETLEQDEAEFTCMGDFTVTHYCCEKYAHICGTGDGITASGTEVTPYRSCAVDPDVIPLGSKVQLYMEDGSIIHCIAEDTGAAIKGNRIDLAVGTHEEAMQAGITTACVYVEVAK